MDVNIPQYRLERLPGGEGDLNMLMYIDSYHDFKGLRGKVGNKSCVPYIDTYMIENRIVSGRESGKSERNNVLGFFAKKGIQYSKIEQSSRLYFEKTYPKSLHGTHAYGTTHTVVTYTDIKKIKKPLKADAIRLELDKVFEKEINNSINIANTYASVAEPFLEWMFPESPNHTEIGISIDAKSALISDLMMPLNDKRKKFYASHVVTPQNILDSARTSFNVLPGIFDDDSSRVAYVNELSREYANVLTEHIGRFQIINTNYSEQNRYGFIWQFVPTTGMPINIPVNQYNSSGPSVNFLANMAIECNSTAKGAKRGQCLTDIANSDKNATMVDLSPVLKTVDRDDFIKLCIDVKRLGDHEQANAVLIRNKTVNCIFVTGDTLSGLYSRILGNPTIYLSTPGNAEDGEENTSSSNALLSYRGLSKITNPLDSAIRRLEYSVDSLNYVIVVYSQLCSLASGTSFMDLKENIESYVDSYEYTDSKLSPDIFTFYNLLTRWRVYDILVHMEDIQRLFVRSQAEIMGKLAELETVLQKIKGRYVDCRTHGANIIVNPGAIDEMNTIADAIETELAKIRPLTEEANMYVKYFNNAKTFDMDGNSIFSFNYELYFSNNKMAPSLAFLNFFVSDIEYIAIQFTRLLSGKILRSSTDEQIRDIISESFYIFVSKFYKTTDVYGKIDLLIPINRILNSAKNFTNKTALQNMIQLLSAIINQNIETSKAYISNKGLGSHIGLATDYAIQMVRAEAEEANVVTNPEASNIATTVVKQKTRRARNAAENAIAAVPRVTIPKRSSRLASLYPKRGGSLTTTYTDSITQPTYHPAVFKYGADIRRNNSGRLITRKNRRNFETSSKLPDVVSIFSSVIDIAIQLFTTYPDMFDIVTGDKALYTQYAQEEEEEEEEAEETNSLNSPQHGGEIIRVGPGVYESDYGFHNQFYHVVKALIYAQELCKNYIELPSSNFAQPQAKRQRLNTTESVFMDEEYVDEVLISQYNKRLFDDIGQRLLSLDAYLTMKGPPDFSIEPRYKKEIYNDIRLNLEYQKLIYIFSNDYDDATFGILCKNSSLMPNMNNMDLAIDQLPEILPYITTGIAIDVDSIFPYVGVAKTQILAAKIDKIDYYLSELRQTVVNLSVKQSVELRHRLSYNIRQIEFLVEDILSIEPSNLYANSVGNWIRPEKTSSSLSASVYSNNSAILTYSNVFANDERYAAFALLYEKPFAKVGELPFRVTRRNRRARRNASNTRKHRY